VRPQDFAQIVVGRGVGRLEPDGLADQIDGVVIPAALVDDHAEQVQGIDMLRVNLEDLTVEPLRLWEVARLMSLHGKIDCLSKRHDGRLPPNGGF
jgi:hypothetical protein